MHQAVDEGDHAGGIGEDLVPFGEHPVRCQDEWTAQLIAPCDDLEEQIGIAGVVGQISDFIATEHGGSGVAAQPSGELRGAVLGGEIVQHVGGGGEACRVAAQHRLMQQVLRDHAFAEPVWTDHDDVGGGLQELQGKELIEERSIELLRPLVVEVGHGLEGAEARRIQTAFETALQPFALLDLEQAAEPGLVEQLLGVGEQAKEAELAQAALQFLKRQGRCRRRYRWCRRA